MPTTIEEVFADRGPLRLMTHVVCGYPDFAACRDLMLAMAAAGVDMIEMQIPFSDPLADGPVIMAANQAALDAGVTPAACIEFAARMRREVSLPLLFMTYGNVPLQFGLDRFCRESAAAGISGLIVPDLPVGSDEGLRREAQAQGLRVIELLSPGMSDERLRLVTKAAQGFLYLTLRVGITGVKGEIDDRGLAMIERVRQTSTLPLAAGFGLKAVEHLRLLAGKADMAVIGSHLLNLFNDNGVAAVGRFCRDSRQASRS